ncbi:hypothetical protein [Streptomyces sp. NPDC091212]
MAERVGDSVRLTLDAPEIPYGWNEICQRAYMSDDGRPSPHWPAG